VRVHHGEIHRRRKEIPFSLGNPKQQMRIGEQRLLAPAEIVERTVHRAPRGFGQSVHWNIEIVDEHRSLVLADAFSKRRSASLRVSARSFLRPVSRPGPSRRITVRASPLASDGSRT
jgi:hypothetical protein